jgi:hypothetical protein
MTHECFFVFFKLKTAPKERMPEPKKKSIFKNIFKSSKAKGNGAPNYKVPPTPSSYHEYLS